MPIGGILTSLSVLGAALQSTFNTVDRSISGMVETTGNAIASVLELGDSLDDLIAILENAATAFSKWVFIDKFVANMTVAEGDLVKLKTSLQDVTLGVEEYRKAMLYAAKTPFAVGEVVRAATLLRTFKFDPFEMVDPKRQRQLIDVLGDMAGAMGLTIADAAHALNRAMVGEWEIMQNRWQISAKMIPQLKGLASGTEAYGKAIIKYLSTTEGSKGATDRFLGGMQLTAKSIRGLTSNIEDAYDILKTAISGTVDAEDLLKGITLYDKIRDNLRKVYQTASDEAPLNVITELNSRYGSLDKKIKDLDKTLNKTLDPKKQTSIKAQIDQQVRALNLVKGELDRNFARLTGGEATFKRMEQLLKKADLIPTNKDTAKQAEAKRKAQVPFLISTGEFNINELISQADKLQQAGRVIGQYLSALYDLVATGIVDYVNRLAQTFLNGTQKFLDNFMDGAISIFNITQKSTTAATLGIVKNTEKYFEFIGNYIQSTAQVGTQRMQIFADDVKRILLEAENPMYRQIMLFSVIVQLMFEFLKLRLERLMNKNPIFITIGNFFKALQEFIPKAIAIAGQAMKKFIEDNKDLINILLPGIAEATSGILDLSHAIDQELANGGGVITNSIVSALQTAVGLVGLFITNSLFFEKIWLRIGAFFTDVFTVVIGNIAAIIELSIIEPIKFLYNLLTTGSITTAIQRANMNFTNSIFNVGFAAADAQRRISDLIPSFETLGDMATVFGGMVSGRNANRTVAEAGYGNQEVTPYIKTMNAFNKAKLMNQIMTDAAGNARLVRDMTLQEYVDAVNIQRGAIIAPNANLFSFRAATGAGLQPGQYGYQVGNFPGMNPFVVNQSLTQAQQNALNAFLKTQTQQQINQMMRLYNYNRGQFNQMYMPQIAAIVQSQQAPIPIPINNPLIQQSQQPLPFPTNINLMPVPATPLNQQIPMNMTPIPGTFRNNMFDPFGYTRSRFDVQRDTATLQPVRQNVNSNNTFTFNVIVDSEAKLSKLKGMVMELHAKGGV